MTEPIIISYAIEVVDAGWLVWRQVDQNPATACGIGRRAHAFPAREAALGEITSQQRADRAAATRLGVTVHHLLTT